MIRPASAPPSEPLVAGALALDAHAAKASTRVVVNASPEPVSNIGISLAEDVGVAGLVTLAVTYPIPTIVVVIILVIAATALTIWLWRYAPAAPGRSSAPGSRTRPGTHRRSVIPSYPWSVEARRRPRSGMSTQSGRLFSS